MKAVHYFPILPRFGQCTSLDWCALCEPWEQLCGEAILWLSPSPTNFCLINSVPFEFSGPESIHCDACFPWRECNFPSSSPDLFGAALIKNRLTHCPHFCFVCFNPLLILLCFVQTAKPFVYSNSPSAHSLWYVLQVPKRLKFMYIDFLR